MNLTLLKLSTCIILVLIFASAIPTIAHAHGRLKASEPAVGASLQESPELLHLIFTERVDSGFTSFMLRNAQGEELRKLPFELEEDERHAVINLASPLDSGAYRLYWKMLSKDDGHPSEGLVPFFIGIEAIPGVEESVKNDSEDPPLIRVVIRWLGLIALLFLTGSLFFPLLIPKQFNLIQPLFNRLLWAALLVVFGTGILDLSFQSQLLESTVFKVLLESRWGQLQLVKFDLVLIIGVLLMLKTTTLIRLWLGRFAGLGLLLSNSSTSHSAGTGVLGTVADWSHSLAAALWLGGLIQLAVLLYPRFYSADDDFQIGLRTTMIQRFSQLALLSVMLLVASGVYAALLHIPNWDALFSTPYGQSLIAKTLLLVAILVLAATLRYWVLPRMRISSTNGKAYSAPGSNIGEMSLFRKLIYTEINLIYAVLFFSSILTLASPPQQTSQSKPEPSLHVFEKTLEEVAFVLEIDSAEAPGEKHFQINIKDGGGNSIPSILRVRLIFDYLDEDLGEVILEPVAERIGEGIYRVVGPYLNLPGSWEITVEVRLRGRADDIIATLPVEVTPIGHIELEVTKSKS